MAEKRGTLAVLTGGGDCPGLNAVIRAVVKTAVTHGYEIYGIRNGFHGLIQDDMKKMSMADVSGILPRGGTLLGTTNRDNPFHYAAGEDAAGNVIYEDRRDDVVRNLNAMASSASLSLAAMEASRLAMTCTVSAGSMSSAFPRPLIMTCRGRSEPLVLTQRWRWLQRHWTAFIPRQNPITASWSLKSWGAMRGGLPFIPALPAERM